MFFINGKRRSQPDIKAAVPLYTSNVFNLRSLRPLSGSPLNPPECTTPRLQFIPVDDTGTYESPSGQPRFVNDARSRCTTTTEPLRFLQKVCRLLAPEFFEVTRLLPFAVMRVGPAGWRIKTPGRAGLLRRTGDNQHTVRISRTRRTRWHCG